MHSDGSVSNRGGQGLSQQLSENGGGETNPQDGFQLFSVQSLPLHSRPCVAAQCPTAPTYCDATSASRVPHPAQMLHIVRSTGLQSMDAAMLENLERGNASHSLVPGVPWTHRASVQ
jgi:hypothetical protein